MMRMNNDPIRVLIADDLELMRRALKTVLDQQPDICVVGQASDGEQAVHFTRLLRPDIVLMDLQMPRLNGIQATRLIVGESPQTQVIVLTTYDTDNLIFNAISAGAQAYVLKETSSSAIIDIIRSVAAGESRLDPTIARKVITEFRRLSLSQAATGPSSLGEAYPLEALTEREAEVLALLAQGKSNTIVAAELSLSEGTVRNYVSKIMSKLHANDRTQLVLTALRAGMVRL
jgi:DNA-binding NarL/FixJ family response regulator